MPGEAGESVAVPGHSDFKGGLGLVEEVLGEGRVVIHGGARELELVGAYAYTNMDNLKNVPAATYGELHEVIYGLNWWWSPDLRWSAAYTQAYVNSGELGGSKKKSSNNTFDIQMSMQF